MAALREQTPVVTPELIPARDGSEVVAATVAGNTLHVDAVTFISGCTAEEQPDVVGFDELGRITAAMHDHVQSWTAPDVLHAVQLGCRRHARPRGALGQLAPRARPDRDG